jgi:imidazolonepropionase
VALSNVYYGLKYRAIFHVFSGVKNGNSSQMAEQPNRRMSQLSKTPKSRTGKTKESVDILIVNAEEMLTLAGSSQTPRTGKEMRDLGIIRDGAVAIRQGKIVAAGKTHDITQAYRGETVLSAKGKTVMPGFVDPHTHLVFAGSREDDFQMRIEGASYMEILSTGGGVLKTVRETQKARKEKLVQDGLERLDLMLRHGTTTVETKSGYGLTTEDEVKLLEAAKRLNQLHCINVVSTFMGAHVSPVEYRNSVDEYVDLVAEEMIPKVADLGLAEFCDVLCDRGIFNLEQAKRVLLAGKSSGLKPKIHADQFGMVGGAKVAANLSAVSADHLNFSSVDSAKAMAEKGVAAVMLPTATFGMMNIRYADARLMIDSGVAVALGTDFNACCSNPNQQLVIAMACHLLHMTPAEAICAATINAAHAICRATEVGSLEVGKRADVAVLGVPNHVFLGYSLGVNLVEKVIANGRLVVDRDRQNEPVFLNRNE